MSSLKKAIEVERNHVQQVNAPPELEQRLQFALEKTNKKRLKHRFAWKWIAIASVFLLSLLVVNHHEGLTYYGKKILGFDHIVSQTLQELNDKGMGQVVDKSITFSNGVTFTVDGVMTDDNQIVMYYTAETAEGHITDLDKDFQPIRLTGFLTDSFHEHGMGNISEDGKTIKGTHSFAPPNGFAKQLTLHFLHTDETLIFSYDPSKALATMIEVKIGQEVTINGTTLKFNQIKASPTMTRIEGKWNGNIEQAELHSAELYVNHELISQHGIGYTTNWRGNTFELRYDALSTPVENIELVFQNGEKIRINVK